MDTKLKSISRNSVTKFIAFIMVVILISVAVVQFLYIDFLGVNPESIIVENYKDSDSAFAQEVNNALHQTYRFLKDDESIPEGINYLYYITDGEKILTNKPGYNKDDFAKNNDAFFAYEDGMFSYGETTNQAMVSWFVEKDDTTMYVSFPDNYMLEQQKSWDAGREALIPLVITFIMCLGIALLLIIYLIFVTGRKPQDNELYTSWIDNIYSEILLAAYIPLGLIWIYAISGIQYFSFYGSYDVTNSSSHDIILYFIGAVTAIVTILCGILLLSLVRKIKGGKFIKQSIIHKVFHNINDFLKSFFDGRRFEKFPLTKSLHLRQIAFIIASAILVFLTFLFILVPPLMIIPPILELVIIYWYVKYNNATFEEINKGFNESLEEQMKSERMKINLVTNVSHDIKTPLTSIISYVDLLSKEEDLSEAAKDYIDILTEKSNRLKNIVADLFDLAKSTSGDINLDFETLDIKRLIEQTLGDMEDDMAKSGLQIKTKLPENPVNIFSDGKKLYRVFQNVIDNALKYSLQGTRVYVGLEEDNGRALATIKNTAGYEMDFSADEILQRFSRGDQSRTTEGSGLGLSIAESFTNVCGGDLKVDIDGDMFKVIISFSLV